VRIAPPPLPTAPPQPPPPRDNVNAAPPAAVPFVPVPVTPQPNLTQTLAPVAIRVAIHAVPLVVLIFFLLVLLLRDIIWGPAVGEDNIPIDPNPKLAVYFDDKGMDEDLGGMQSGTMSWGLVEIPKTKEQVGRKLTYSKYGRTNSTVLKIAGNVRAMLGHPTIKDWKMIVRGEELGKHGGKKTVWLSNDPPDQQIQVTQLVEIIPGEPVEFKGKLKRYYDTCVVRYQIENKGKEPVAVGLRIMIDTLIGVDKSGDGVPFTVPGMRGLVDKDHSARFPSGQLPVPDFIQVLEKPSLKDSGLVAFMNLKLGGAVEPPGRVLLTHWHKGLGDWEIPERPFRAAGDDENDDSAVVLYWEEKDLYPGKKREVGFSYGLGNLSISSGGRLGISVGGSLVKDSDLTLVTLVNNPKAGEELTLKLPAGLKLVEGDAKQAVPAAGASDQSPVTWRIRAERAGTFTIEVHSSTGVSQKKSITIRTKTIF
jgi:hypothetical protein